MLAKETRCCAFVVQRTQRRSLVGWGLPHRFLLKPHRRRTADEYGRTPILTLSWRAQRGNLSSAAEAIELCSTGISACQLRTNNPLSTRIHTDSTPIINRKSEIIDSEAPEPRPLTPVQLKTQHSLSPPPRPRRRVGCAHQLRRPEINSRTAAQTQRRRRARTLCARVPIRLRSGRALRLCVKRAFPYIPRN